jgi:Homeobox KN domain
MFWEEVDKFTKEYASQIDPSNHDHFLQCSPSQVEELYDTNAPAQQDTKSSYTQQSQQPIHQQIHPHELQQMQQQLILQHQQQQQYPEQVHVTKKRQNFSREITQTLTEWLTAHYDHPYPSEQEKEALGQKVGLKVSQISGWMIKYPKRSIVFFQNKTKHLFN